MFYLKYFLVLVISFVLISSTFIVIGQESSTENTATESATPSNDPQRNQVENKIQEYQQKLTEVRREKNTLATQMEYMDAQIQLAGYRIVETEDSIIQTQKEIEVLESRINGLDTSLDYLSKLMLERIVSGYKEKSPTFFDVVLNSTNANELINKFKYVQLTQQNNQRVLIQVQEAKLNFEEQRNMRERKKIELNRLTAQLEQQQQNLNTQKQDKQRLLEVTKNDEATYQRLLNDAQKQLASFRSFVSAAGGGSITANSFGSGSDGAYFSQRDERWSGMRMGSSNESVLEVGCLVTSIAMVLKHSGQDITPASIASQSQYFFANTAYMLHPSRFSWQGGKKYANIPVSQIKNELANGNHIITGVYAGKYGTHYVVITGEVDGTYIMHDPYYGPDKKFTDHYSTSSIFVAAVMR